MPLRWAEQCASVHVCQQSCHRVRGSAATVATVAAARTESHDEPLRTGRSGVEAVRERGEARRFSVCQQN